jgi:hypothetical protein
MSSTAHDEVVKDTTAVKLSGRTDWLVADGDDLYVGTDRSVSAENNLYTLSEGERLSRTSGSWVVSEGTSYLRRVIRPVPHLGDLADVEALDAAEGEVLAYDSEGKWSLTALPEGSSAREVDAYDDSYTLVPTDAGKVILMNSSSAQVVTLDEDTAFEEGQEAVVVQGGEGALSFTDDGVTVNAGPGLEALGTYAVITVLCVGEDEYVLHGDLTSTEEV